MFRAEIGLWAELEISAGLTTTAKEVSFRVILRFRTFGSDRPGTTLLFCPVSPVSATKTKHYFLRI